MHANNGEPHWSGLVYLTVCTVPCSETYKSSSLSATQGQKIVVHVGYAIIPFLLDVRPCGRTSRGHTGGRSHKISPPPSFCGTVLALISHREKDSTVPFPSSTVKSNSVYPRNNRSPLGHNVRKNHSSCDCAEIPTHVPTSEGFEVTN